MNKVFNKYKLELPMGSNLTEMTSNLQDATEDHIAFYRLQNNKSSQESFLKRLEGIKPGLLVLSSEPNVEISQPYVVLDFEKFLPFQIELAEIIYPKSFEVKLIGVTGTNGKSTVVHLANEILKANGKTSFTIGTIGIFDGDKEVMSAPGATTPSYIDLRRILHKLSDYDFACIEVSSHALDQDRLNGIKLACAGWTNLTQDHLDYHGTMDSYFEAKALIRNATEHSVIIPHGEQELERLFNEKSIQYQVATKVNVEILDDSFALHYNAKNIALAKALVEKVLQNEVSIPNSITLPKGRYNSFRLNNSLFVVDYAHTPDAIRNVVDETKNAFPHAYIISIFGCGGDRDRKKRPLMLEAALDGSDEVVVTTDNPRSEKPEDIINDAIAGNEKNSKVSKIVNREDAIKEYIKDYDSETIVIIAGKGHEEYQEVNGVKNYFSDIEIVKDAINGLKK